MIWSSIVALNEGSHQKNLISSKIQLTLAHFWYFFWYNGVNFPSILIGNRFCKVRLLQNLNIKPCTSIQIQWSTCHWWIWINYHITSSNCHWRGLPRQRIKSCFTTSPRYGSCAYSDDQQGFSTVFHKKFFKSGSSTTLIRKGSSKDFSTAFFNRVFNGLLLHS